MERNRNENTMSNKGFFGIIFIGIIVLLIIIALFSSFYIVRAGERGIIMTFGDPSEIPSSEGLHFKVPIAQKIEREIEMMRIDMNPQYSGNRKFPGSQNRNQGFAHADITGERNGRY